MRALAVVLLVVLAGCADTWDALTRPDLPVRTSALTSDAWTTDPTVRALVDEPGHLVRIEARSGDKELAAEALDEARLLLADGTWDIRVEVDGKFWAKWSGVRVDATPPAFPGLEGLGTAQGGVYVLGANAQVEGASAVRVLLPDGTVVGSGLPLTLTGIGATWQAYLVSATDEAGNMANRTVYVREGDRLLLPPGTHELGVVASYAASLQLWDLTASRLTPEQARAEAGGAFLGAGHGIEPTNPDVVAFVAEHVTAQMDTMEAARALFAAMADHLEYDESRLEQQGLLRPADVLWDRESSSGADADDDGLVDSGSGNGVRGGVCRDLAATYVSLLRAAGIPARLVSGYVAGQVNGFHAWVEFYAGAVGDESPWVPVDVSPIDGPFTVGMLVQAFGIRHPDYLALRVVPETAEASVWSTALGFSYRSPGNAPEPVVRFAKAVTDLAHVEGTLCFDAGQLARAAASRPDDCPPRMRHYVDGVTRFSHRVLDYGVAVDAAPAGTHLRAEISLPVPPAGGLEGYDLYPATFAFTVSGDGAYATAEKTYETPK